MSITSIDLRRQRQKLLDQAKALVDRAERERRELTAGEKDTFDFLLREAESVKDMIERIEGPLSDRMARAFDPRMMVGPVAAPTGQEEPLSLRTLDGREVRALRPGESLAQNLPDEDRTSDVPAEALSIGRLVRGLATGNWRGAEAERRAMGVGSDVLGGYLVPPELSARVIDLARNQARVLQAGALTVPMGSTELTLARIEQDPKAGWKAEHAAATVSDMTFGAVKLRARTLMGIVKLSIELLEDAPNVDSVVERALAAALALEMDRAALRGSGQGEEPRGVRFTEGVQLVPVNGALTSFDPFSEAAERIARVNGPTDGLAAIYSPRTWGQLDRLKDNEGRPLAPPRSFEQLRRLVTNQVPENLGDGEDETEIFVADFRQLLWGVRTGLRIEVSREAADSDSSAFRHGQVWIRAYLRGDVALARPDHFVVLTGIKPS